MKKYILKLLVAISMGGLFLSCTRSGDEAPAAALTNQSYFDEAAKYITTNTSFGSQTDLTQAMNPKIEFSNAVLKPVYGLTNKLATPLTLRKEFIQSADGKLIMLRRKLPSLKDGTTMTVGMRSGVNRVRTIGTRQTVTQCNAIVFNADGQAVCLVVNNGVISSAKVASSYGTRLISSVQDLGGGNLTVKSKRQFSIKSLQGGVIVNKKFDGHSVP